MDPKKIIRELCNEFRYDLSVLNNAIKVYENSIRKGYDKKYSPIGLAAGSLYFYCKSTGKPIILSKVTESAYIDQEEIVAVYNDLKKDALG